MLHILIFYSDEDEVANLLVTAKADVNSKNNKGATPLIIAAVKGHHSVLRILANHPAVRLHEQVCWFMYTHNYIHAIHTTFFPLLYVCKRCSLSLGGLPE